MEATEKMEESGNMEELNGVTVVFIGEAYSTRRGIPRLERVMMVSLGEGKGARRILYNSLQNFFGTIDENMAAKKNAVNVLGKKAGVDEDCSAAEGAPSLDAVKIQLLDAGGHVCKTIT